MISEVIPLGSAVLILSKHLSKQCSVEDDWAAGVVHLPLRRAKRIARTPAYYTTVVECFGERLQLSHNPSPCKLLPPFPPLGTNHPPRQKRRTSLRHEHRNDFVPMPPVDAEIGVQREHFTRRVNLRQPNQTRVRQ